MSIVLTQIERRFLVSIRDGCTFEAHTHREQQARRNCRDNGLATCEVRVWSVTEKGMEALRAKPVKQTDREPLSLWAVGK